ncbi:hypothetical protein SNEBB_000936 [Seison nebaliae]|nr:hypothetical protein SNEBB_000936 [Seison nebaliae]
MHVGLIKGNRKHLKKTKINNESADEILENVLHNNQKNNHIHSSDNYRKSNDSLELVNDIGPNLNDLENQMHGGHAGVHVHDYQEYEKGKVADWDDYKRWLKDHSETPERLGIIARFRSLAKQVKEYSNWLNTDGRTQTIPLDEKENDEETESDKLQEKIMQALHKLEEEERTEL